MTDTAVSNQIIQTLEYLFEKFGIAVNWSTETVLPAVQELMGRYAKYEIISSCAWICLCALVMLPFIYLLKKAFNDYGKSERAESTPFWVVHGFEIQKWETSNLMDFVICFSTIFGIISILTILCNVFHIISWAYLPEVEFAKEVAHLIEHM